MCPNSYLQVCANLCLICALLSVVRRMQGTICIPNRFCAMDSRARGLHLTWLSSVARPTNWFCDWCTDQWISPPFPDGCAGRLQMWPCMLRAGLHRGRWDLSGPTGVPMVHLVVRDGDKWGTLPAALTSPIQSHWVNMETHAVNQAPAVYANRRKLASVCEVTLWFAYLNLGTLPDCRECGIPSLTLSLLWQKTHSKYQLSLYSWRNVIYWGIFPPHIRFPVRMLQLCNYAVMYVDIFYSIWFLPKLSDGVSPWEIWNRRETVFFYMLLPVQGKSKVRRMMDDFNEHIAYM